MTLIGRITNHILFYNFNDGPSILTALKDVRAYGMPPPQQATPDLGNVVVRSSFGDTLTLSSGLNKLIETELGISDSHAPNVLPIIGYKTGYLNPTSFNPNYGRFKALVIS